MPGIHETIFRQWHLLRALPRAPQKVTVRDLGSALAKEGFNVTDRTVQRDLIVLSSIFPLHCDDREKPFGWSWLKGAPGFDLPGLTAPEALTLAMCERDLRALLPAPFVDQMQPLFAAAKRQLDAEARTGSRRPWMRKVRSVPPWQPLLPPKIDAVVQRVLSEALLLERQVNVRYRRRGDDAPVEYRIHPLAFVQRGPVLYASVRIKDYPDVRTLALHRIEAAGMLDDRVQYPKGFSIDEQIAAGVWGFGSAGTIKLEVVFQPGYGEHLFETPLSEDQVIEEYEDGRLRVKATLQMTPQLQWWILGFGDGVEAIGPARLRRAIARAASRMLHSYHAPPRRVASTLRPA
jgi:predicted DNA-binding transcriptional regulator YafY